MMLVGRKPVKTINIRINAVQVSSTVVTSRWKVMMVGPQYVIQLLIQVALQVRMDHSTLESFYRLYLLAFSHLRASYQSTVTVCGGGYKTWGNLDQDHYQFILGCYLDITFSWSCSDFMLRHFIIMNFYSRIYSECKLLMHKFLCFLMLRKVWKLHSYPSCPFQDWLLCATKWVVKFIYSGPHVGPQFPGMLVNAWFASPTVNYV